jgi:hypothetical protein
MIDAMIRNTPGVVSVNDQLQVAYAPTGPYSANGVYSPPAPIAAPPPIVTPGLAPGGLRVQPSTAADRPIADSIVDELRRDSIPPEWVQNVIINVTGGTVYLQGTVADQQRREAIISAAQHARGVNAIYDQLAVR